MDLMFLNVNKPNDNKEIDTHTKQKKMKKKREWEREKETLCGDTPTTSAHRNGNYRKNALSVN